MNQELQDATGVFDKYFNRIARTSHKNRETIFRRLSRSILARDFPEFTIKLRPAAATTFPGRSRGAPGTFGEPGRCAHEKQVGAAFQG